MARRRDLSGGVPDDLRVYDHRHWEAVAALEERADGVPLHMRAHDAYEEALATAGVDANLVDDLVSEAFDQDARRRLGAL